MGFFVVLVMTLLVSKGSAKGASRRLRKRRRAG
jgi:hypothetical protein